MEDWNLLMISAIDQKLHKAKHSDLRFFRVEEFKRNVERTGSFAGKCPMCTKHQTDIRAAVNKIDLAINVPGRERRDYDRLISRLSSHMQTGHGYYTPSHFTYRLSFYGMLIGAAAGFLLMMLLSEYNWAYVSAGFSAGLLLGYLYGGQKDRKIRDHKMLM